MSSRETFLTYYDRYIKRAGSAQLLSWIQKDSDFFTAPASSKFHSSYEGGLLDHSLNVFEGLMERYPDGAGYTPETFAVCGLLHDLCKANFYKKTTRNVKNQATGIWEQVPYYTIDDSFPYGHGEKSVFLIERFMRLTEEEAIAIRWHMGGFDNDARSGGYNISRAFERYRLAVMLHVADLEATYLTEIPQDISET